MNEKVATAIAEVLSLITSRDANERERGSDEVTDISKGIGRWGRETVSRALVITAAVERNPAALEAQLNALTDLRGFEPLEKWMIETLQLVDRTSANLSAIEHLDDLLMSQSP